ncbi:MAG: LytTR family DNA-binding domain-containing protein [Saprospiraceae bacterium]|nr:LytTR family DNA-binding domain-containing protein [Saprospiraceae bacterium]
MLLNAIIVDDEPHSLTAIELKIKKHCPEVKVVEKCSTADDAIEKINALKPSVIFLDVNLGPKNGFDVLEEVKHFDFEVIFLSDYKQYAIDAFRVGAIHYLPKPIDIDELKKAVEKARKNIARSNKKTRITVPISNGIRIIQTNDIIYCKAQNNFTQIFIAGDTKSIMTPRNLGRIGGKLPTGQFMRIHNGHIVNLCHVKSFQKTAGGHVVMTGDIELRVAQPKKEQLLDALVNLDDICDSI